MRETETSATVSTRAPLARKKRPVRYEAYMEWMRCIWRSLNMRRGANVAYSCPLPIPIFPSWMKIMSRTARDSLGMKLNSDLYPDADRHSTDRSAGAVFLGTRRAVRRVTDDV